ncbi:V-type ATPase subunit [Mycoplasmatota bacterium]|nr:V-type ATPase subunit [Mycoplasmatota bacterium]
MNITKIYRLKKFYHADPITIRNVLVDEYSKMSEKKLDELALIEDPDKLIDFIDKQHHFNVADEDDYVYIEYYTGKLRHEVARRLMYFSTNVPEIYAAFIFLSEFEVENLINIIEGIRYQVDEEEMKQMLIY